jgi:myo-inositol-1(or 4)-monophosphatase
MTNLGQDFDLLRHTAKEAASLALSYFNRPLAIKRKPDGTTVTEADLAIDALLAARLKSARPDYGWLSEESLENERRLQAARVWIADPIDGTQAFVKGADDWTIALCLVEDGAPVLSAVVNPVRNEFYEARAGAGAFLNGLRISVSGRTGLEGARIAASPRPRNNGTWKPPWPGAVHVGVNSSIYRLALVACGLADVSFALNPKWEWDIAAGALLVMEAGGTATTKSGTPLTFNSAEARVPGLIAAAPGLHGILLERLR